MIRYIFTEITKNMVGKNSQKVVVFMLNMRLLYAKIGKKLWSQMKKSDIHPYQYGLNEKNEKKQQKLF